MKKFSFAFSLAGHALLIVLLLITFERTITIPAQFSQQEPQEIIEAVMIDQRTLQKEVERLQTVERKKKEQELARVREIKRKEAEAIEKQKKEEALLVELKKKNEQLKKEAEQERLAKEKREKAEKAEKKKQEEEALAQKRKIEDEKKRAEEQARQQASLKIKQDQITHFAMLMRNKIHQYWRQPMGFDINGMACKVEVKLLPTGEVVDAVVIRSSGNLEFDRSTELAIRKASPLPMPTDADVAKEFRQFSFTFNPEAA